MLEKKYSTDFLFVTSTLLTGWGSIFNIAGNYFEYNYIPTPEEADGRAIENDWGVIGKEIIKAAKRDSAKQLSFSFA